MRISDWSSDVCSSDLLFGDRAGPGDDIFGQHGGGLAQIERLCDRGLVVRSLEFRAQPADQSLGLFGSAFLVERDEAGKDFLVGEISRPAIGLSDEGIDRVVVLRSEEHTSELQALMRSSYAVFCL